MSIPARLAVALVLWLPFSLAGIIAIVVTAWVIIFGDHKQQQGYGKNVLRAMDKVMAAVCGFEGHYTLSAECGVASSGWPAALRTVLDRIQPGHCYGAAVNESHPLAK